MRHATRRDVTWHLPREQKVQVRPHTKTEQYGPLNQKSPGQRQALYSGIEGSSYSLLHSPLLNVHSLHYHTRYIQAHASRFRAARAPATAASLATPPKGDRFSVLVMSIFVCIFLYCILHSMFPCSRLPPPSVHLSLLLSYFRRHYSTSYVQYVCWHPVSSANAILSAYKIHDSVAVPVSSSALRFLLAFAMNSYSTKAKKTNELGLRTRNFNIIITSGLLGP